MAELDGVREIPIRTAAPTGILPDTGNMFVWAEREGSSLVYYGMDDAGVVVEMGLDGVISGNINVDDITANDLTLTGAGNYVKHELGWKDNVANFASGKLGGALNDPDWRQMINGIYAYRFNDGSIRELFISFHINHDYKVGTNIFPHIHWAPEDSGSGTVRWGFEYTIAKGHQQSSFGSTSTIYIEQDTTGETLKHMIAEHPTGISSTELETDAIVMVRVFRDGTHANDTYNSRVFGLMGDLHYQSEKELTLNKAPNFDA